jgi:cell wall-associated NlpC family hydrolase
MLSYRFLGMSQQDGDQTMPFMLSIPGRWLLIAGVVIMATQCAGHPPRSFMPSTAGSTELQAQGSSEPQIVGSAKAADYPAHMEQRLRAEVSQWEGTPHRMGGTSRRGIDCSGFVQRLYRDIFALQIPRSTNLQVKSGRAIDISRLRTGDLVFFRLPHKKGHVGIYLGQAEFAHASTTKGVMISSLREHFWRQSYWTARRYLEIRRE